VQKYNLMALNLSSHQVKKKQHYKIKASIILWVKAKHNHNNQEII